MGNNTRERSSMEKVYVAVTGEWPNGYHILGIYTNFEAAEKVIIKKVERDSAQFSTKYNKIGNRWNCTEPEEQGDFYYEILERQVEPW